MFSNCWPPSEEDREPPSASADRLRFFLMHVSYAYDRRRGTLIHLHGNSDVTGAPVHVQLFGYLPHFFFRLPDDWDTEDVEIFLGALNAGFVSNLKALLLKRRKSRSYNAELWSMVDEETENYVVDWKTIVGEELVEARGEEGVRFVDVRVLGPKLVRLMREFVENPKGRAEGSGPNDRAGWVPRWLDGESDRLTRDVGKLLLFEADVDFTIRFLVDHRIAPCRWFDVPSDAFVWKSRVTERRRVNSLEDSRPAKAWGTFPSVDRPRRWRRSRALYEKRVSTCCFEGLVHHEALRQLPVSDDSIYANKLPDFRILSFDIEAENEGGREFPNATRHRVLQISNYLHSMESPEHRSYLFALEKTGLPDDCSRVFWFSDERDLLVAWRRFVLETDPDVISGHNSNGFDIPYLLTRAATLGIEGFATLGRLANGKAYVQRSVNKGFTKHNAVVPERLTIDTMRLEQEVPGALQTSLAACSARYLKRETKVDLDYSLITRCQRTPAGRLRLGKYCLVDSKLVMLLLKKNGAVRMAASTAQLAAVPPQTCLNRSQGVKMEGGLRQICNPLDGPPKLKIVRSFAARRDGNVRASEDGYVGATVLPPIAGYYTRPVMVLDFVSLYPSIMRAWNMCLSTLVRPETIERLGYVEGVHYRRPAEIAIDAATGEPVERKSAVGPAFLTVAVKAGLLPRQQEKLAGERAAYRARQKTPLGEMKAAERLAIEEFRDGDGDGEEWKAFLARDDNERRWTAFLEAHAAHKRARTDWISLESKQLAVKVWMNSIYGLLGDRNSPYYCPEIASSVTLVGRGMILTTKSIVEKEYTRALGVPFDAKVIYGDTDSVMILLDADLSREEVESWGAKIAARVTTAFVPPIRLGYEKMYRPFNLTGKKKNYYGAKFLPGNEKPEIDVTGCDFVKFRLCAYVKEVCNGAVEIACLKPLAERLNALVAHLRAAMDAILRGEVFISSLVESQKLGRELPRLGIAKESGKVAKKVPEGPAVKLLRREWESQRRRCVALGLPEPDLPGPGRIAEYVSIVPKGVPSSSVKRKGDRISHPLDVVKNRERIDWDAYRDVLEIKVGAYFANVIAALEDLERGEPSKTTPKKRREECVGRTLYGGPRRKSVVSVSTAEGSGIGRFFIRRENCPVCGEHSSGETITCDSCRAGLSEALSKAKLESRRASNDRKEIWEKCTRCIDGDEEEAAACVSVRCRTFGRRIENEKHIALNDERAKLVESELARATDIEDLYRPATERKKRRKNERKINEQK